MTSDTEWKIVECDEDLVERLAQLSGLPRPIARLLVIRGITTPSDAYTFFNPSLEHLHDPFLLPDLDIAVDRLTRAIRAGEPICVHGDYDVDGVTGTALLVRTLRALKADVRYRIPNRKRDGYGIKPQAVIESAQSGSRLIVTCDCGITAYDAAETARQVGIDVIITDHHQPGAYLPDAVAVVNPKRSDARYPFPELAGVGVAFKLAQGLVRKLELNEESFVSRFTDLVALGTVSDVVPLLGENRSIVKHGLEVLPETRKVGLRTMIRCVGLEGKPLTAHYLAYILGPRINAAGRMDDATSALRLLLTREEEEAERLIKEIETHNNRRRAEQDKVFDEAVNLARQKVEAGMLVLVLSGTGWNRGVIGIVAGRICELFNRPTILISRDERHNIGSGSARSIPEFNLMDGLQRCEECLIKFGGHALAAGLSIELSKLDLFEEMINAVAAETLAVAELAPCLEIEAEVSPQEITSELARTVKSMEPFGNANPEPLFVTNSLKVVEVRRVGDGSHLKLKVWTDGCTSAIDCIGFGFGDWASELDVGDLVDLCYSIRIDEYQSSESVQLLVKDIRRSEQTFA